MAIVEEYEKWLDKEASKQLLNEYYVFIVSNTLRDFNGNVIQQNDITPNAFIKYKERR